MEDGNNDRIEMEAATVPTDEPRVQEAEIHRIVGETSNANILKHGQTDYSPCLRDVIFGRTKTSNVFKRMIEVLDRGVVQRIGQRPDCFRQDVQLAQYQRQLLPNLPDPTSQSRHVYVVTKPHLSRKVSRFHWSVYSQGYFYHLSTRSPEDLSVFSGLRNKASGAQLVLKIEDLSTTDSADYVKAATAASNKAIVAYEMGSTEYDPVQLQILAQWIITSQPGGNDHCSTFVGSKTQLVDWDLRARHNDDVDRGARNPYDYEHGYLVRKPQIRRGWSVLTRRPFFALFSVSGAKLEAIRSLYEHGPAVCNMVLTEDHTLFIDLWISNQQTSVSVSGAIDVNTVSGVGRGPGHAAMGQCALRTPKGHMIAEFRLFFPAEDQGRYRKWYLNTGIALVPLSTRRGRPSSPRRA